MTEIMERVRGPKNGRQFFRAGSRAGWWLLLLLFLPGLLFSGCARAPESPPPAAGGPVGRAAWQELARVRALKASAVLSWEAADGRHGKNRVRMFLSPPSRLKIQWLTPWGSVAGQLLVAKGHFWLSDSRRRQTWYGRVGSLAGCFPGQSGAGWVSTSRFLSFWPLLFSSPDEDRKLAGGGVVSYAGGPVAGRLEKKLVLPDGEAIGIVLAELEAAPEPARNEQIFARRFSVSGPGGRVVLELRSYQLQDRFPDQTFVYEGKNFNLYPCMDE
jgi:outer membrane lipoprotein-sorting protein